MVSYAVSSDIQPLDFNTCCTPVGALSTPAPAFTEWWATDVNLGDSTWMLSARHTKDSVEYVIWDARNSAYINTSCIVLSSSNVIGKIPMRYFVWWVLCILWEYIKMWWTYIQLEYMLWKMYITMRVRPYRSRMSKYCARLRKMWQARVETTATPSSPPEPR